MSTSFLFQDDFILVWPTWFLFGVINFLFGQHGVFGCEFAFWQDSFYAQTTLWSLVDVVCFMHDLVFLWKSFHLLSTSLCYTDMVRPHGEKPLIDLSHLTGKAEVVLGFDSWPTFNLQYLGPQLFERLQMSRWLSLIGSLGSNVLCGTSWLCCCCGFVLSSWLSHFWVKPEVAPIPIVLFFVSYSILWYGVVLCGWMVRVVSTSPVCLLKSCWSQLNGPCWWCHILVGPDCQVERCNSRVSLN